ncbi:MAG: hypothetical protein ABSG17_22035 [Spirochaetia bacterium]|jgi:hypothetical protein
MRTRAFILPVAFFAVIILAAIGAPAFAGSVHLTGSLSADFLKGPSAQQIIDSFTSTGQPPFSGFGWEVIIGKVGLGGEYDASFFRTTTGAWWLDWYSQPLFLSYHFFRTGYFLDPFLQAGLGGAGRVHLDEWTGSDASNLYISIFPFIAGGLSLDLSGLLLSGKVSYAPFMTPPPATVFSNSPLGSVQVTLSAGIALDW